MIKKKIWIITLFPEFFDTLKQIGVIGSALRGERGNICIEAHFINPSLFSAKSFKGIDDAPYGGGPGMVMRADVLKSAILEGIVGQGGYSPLNWKDDLKVIYTAPRGRTWNNDICQKFAKNNFIDPKSKDLIFVCGRYEGIDERFLNNYVDEYYSLGNFVLSGGELAVMAFLDSTLRFIPGVLGNQLSSVEESFQKDEIEEPHYTRPATFDGEGVPKILLSGNHKLIEEYRKSERMRMTKAFRPDLLSLKETKK